MRAFQLSKVCKRIDSIVGKRTLTTPNIPKLQPNGVKQNLKSENTTSRSRVLLHISGFNAVTSEVIQVLS